MYTAEGAKQVTVQAPIEQTEALNVSSSQSHVHVGRLSTLRPLRLPANRRALKLSARFEYARCGVVVLTFWTQCTVSTVTTTMLITTI